MFFRDSEFYCKCDRDCIGKHKKISENLLARLNTARRIAKIPFIITSGLRCPEHNAEIGGKPDSAHLEGFAVDIKTSNSMDRYKIFRALLSAGFNRIGIAKDFIHADIDPNKPSEVIWTY